jgi:hypothetical protein
MLLVKRLSIFMLSVMVLCVAFFIVMLSAVMPNVTILSVKASVAQLVEQLTNDAKF